MQLYVEFFFQSSVSIYLLLLTATYC